MAYMSAAGSPLMDGIRESLDRYAKPEAAAAVQLRRGKLGARAEVLGAVTLVLGDTSRWSFIGLRTAAGLGIWRAPSSRASSGRRSRATSASCRSAPRPAGSVPASILARSATSTGSPAGPGY